MKHHPVANVRPLQRVSPGEQPLVVILVCEESKTRGALPDRDAVAIIVFRIYLFACKVFEGRDHSGRIHGTEPGFLVGTPNHVDVVWDCQFFDEQEWLEAVHGGGW